MGKMNESEKTTGSTKGNRKPKIVAVGSIALDSITAPSGTREEILGGSAVFFSAAAGLYVPVAIVGVVGRDFPEEHMAWLRKRGVLLDGLKVEEGRTFRWKGEYRARDINEAISHCTELNVFDSFAPELPSGCLEPDILFLANIDPELQLDVLQQAGGAGLVACDTMNYWIQTKRDVLEKVFQKVDVLFLNEGEARLLTGERSALSAAEKVSKMGPTWVVLKRGEYGSLLYGEGLFFAPPYPAMEVRDPTGAGDSFAGGFLGYTAERDERGNATFRSAMFHGAAAASFALADFSVEGFELVGRKDVERRFQRLVEMTKI